MHSPVAATALLEPIPRSPIHPKAAARFPAVFRALFRFPTRTVRKPQEVVVLVTIEACLMVDTDDRQWGRHTRNHRNRENGENSRRPYAPVSQAAAGTASDLCWLTHASGFWSTLPTGCTIISRRLPALILGSLGYETDLLYLSGLIALGLEGAGPLS